MMSIGCLQTGSLIVALLLTAGRASAQTSQPAPPSSPENVAPTTAPAPDKTEKPRSYYVASKAIGVRTDTQPPSYVKTVDKYGLPKDMSWLEFGAQQRTRFEVRDDDYREGLRNDSRFLMREQAYVGVRDILDPLRLGFEFNDSRVEGGDFDKNNRDINEADILQAFAELYFKDFLGKDRPVRFQAGRLTLDYLDRRLVSRGRWGNAIGSFDGFRMQLGQRDNDWQLDYFSAMPVNRRLTRPDHGNDQRWLHGIVGDWRRWSKWVTIQPYYFIFDQDLGEDERNIHTMGVRAYGNLGDTGFDYDSDVSFQFGNNRGQSQRAAAIQEEVGYTFKKVPWKPRVAVVSDYATGDRNPYDRINNRFDKLYGNGNALNQLDLFELSNVITEALRLSADPTGKIHAEFLYRTYWLASDRDAWTVPNRRNPAGNSGHFVGHSLETYVTWKVLKQVDLDIGYAQFLPGTFVRDTGPAPDSSLFYVQSTVKLDR